MTLLTFEHEALWLCCQHLNSPFGAIPQEALTLELSATEKVTRWPRLGTVTKPHLFSLITLELKSRGP